jgi:hypothetical protein
MAMQYAHLAPEHRLAAIAALVRAPELSRNFTERPAANHPTTAK